MAEQPHKWAILNDYAKSVITLATSLLALCVTFADKLGSSSPEVVTRFLLGVLWFCLGLATVCGVLLFAALFGVLRRKSRLEEIEGELGQTGQPATVVAALQSEKGKWVSEVEERERLLTVVTNGTYLSIIASVVAFFVLGLQQRSPTQDLSQLVETATKEAGVMRNVHPSDLKVVGVDLAPSGDIYTVQLLPPTGAPLWVLEISASDGRIRKFR